MDRHLKTTRSLEIGFLQIVIVLRNAVYNSKHHISYEKINFNNMCIYWEREISTFTDRQSQK